MTFQAQTGRFGETLAIALSSAIAALMVLSSPALAPLLARSYGMNAEQVGWYFAVEAGGIACAAIPAFFWIPRVAVRTINPVVGALFVVANIASGMSTSYDTLLVWRTIASLSGGSLMISGYVAMRTLPNHAYTIGATVALQLFFSAVMIGALPRLAATFGLRIAYWIAALAMLGSLPLLRISRAAPQSVSPAKADGGVGANSLRVIGVFIFYFAIGGIWTFLGHLGKSFHLGSAVDTVLVVAASCGILGGLAAAVLSVSALASIGLGAGYACLVAAITALIGVPGLIRYALGAFLFKFAWTFVVPFVLASITRRGGTQFYMLLMNVTINSGVALGPPCFGYLLDHSRSDVVFVTLGIACATISAMLISLPGLTRQSATVRDEDPERRLSPSLPTAK